MKTPLPEKSPEHTDYLGLVKKQNMIIDYLKEREDVPQENVTDLKVSIYGNGSAGTIPPPPVTTIEEMKEKFLISADLKGKIGENMLNEIITAAQDQRTAEIRDYIEQVIQEERFSGAPFALNKIIAHLKSELDQPKD